jgi:predicted phage tail protein
MALNSGSGREDGGGAYRKPAGLTANQGTLYAVAGSASETKPGPFNHPAMFTSLERLGSLVIDIDGDRLDGHFVRDTGAIDDYFTIRKDVQNAPPTVSLTSPLPNASFNAPANIAISANAADSDGSIKQVDFYAGNQVIGTRTAAPWSITWQNVSAGTYALSAAATDNLGVVTASSPVTVTVQGQTIPAPPSNLVATAKSRKQINVAWRDNSNNESGFRLYRSNDGKSFTRIATLSANTTSYANTGLTDRKTYYYRVTAYNSLGESAPSNTLVAATTK